MPTGYEYAYENNRNTTIEVGVTAVKIMERVPKGTRIAFSLGNESTGAQIITLGFGEAGAVNEGIAMRIGGKHMEAKSEGFEPFNGEVWAISSGASAILSIYERQRAVM